MEKRMHEEDVGLASPSHLGGKSQGSGEAHVVPQAASSLLLLCQTARTTSSLKFFFLEEPFSYDRLSYEGKHIPAALVLCAYHPVEVERKGRVWWW